MVRLAELMKEDDTRADVDAVAVTAARSLLKKRGSLAKWATIVAELDARRTAAVRVEEEAAATYRVACVDAAQSKPGADQKQRDCFEVLKAARTEAELALGALVAAEAERDAAQRADELVRRDDYRLSREKTLAEAKVAVRAALEEHQKNLRALSTSDNDLRAALSHLSVYWPTLEHETNPLADINHMLGICYTVSLPHVWLPGTYDNIRAGFQAPGDWHEKARIPSFAEAFNRYVE